MVAAMTRIALSRATPRAVRVTMGGVRLEGARSLGVREMSYTRFQSARQADGQMILPVRSSSDRANAYEIRSAGGSLPAPPHNESHPYTLLCRLTPIEFAITAAKILANKHQILTFERYEKPGVPQ